MSGEQRHRQIVAVVLATDPTLSAPLVEAAIAAVAGHRSRATALGRGVDRRLGRVEDGGAAGGRSARRGVQGPVSHVAAGAELRGLRTGRRPLTRSSTEGGSAPRCRRRELAAPCARCGVIKPVAGRRRRNAGRSAPAAQTARNASADGADGLVGSPDAPTATSPTSATAASASRGHLRGLRTPAPCGFAARNADLHQVRAASRRHLRPLRPGQAARGELG